MGIADCSMRAAVVGERAALEALQLRASLVWPDQREQLLAHPDAISIDDALFEAGLVRVACVDGVVVGFSVTLPIEAEAVELDGLFVEPSSMRGGVGRALVEDASALASEAGAKVMMVVAHPRALGFYERVGFVNVGDATTRFGPAVRMRRALLRS